MTPTLFPKYSRRRQGRPAARGRRAPLRGEAGAHPEPAHVH